MKTRTLSLIGIFGLLLALILINGVSKTLFSRVYFDLTEDKLYTLSTGTKNILNSIEEPVTLKFYFSKTEGAKYPAIKLYGTRILDLLKQYERASSGKLKLEIYDPRPDSEEEEWADKYGLTEIPGQSGEKLFLGLAGINSFGDEESVPVFNFQRQEFLEYDITKVVNGLVNPKKPVIGVMSSLDVLPSSRPSMAMGMQGDDSGWFAFTQLAESVQLQKVPTDAIAISKDIDLLMVVHPKNLSDPTLFAIDQFVMNGGRLLVLEDPYSQSDVPQSDPQNPMAAMMADHSSSLNKLTAKWGVEMTDKKVVADMKLGAKVNAGNGMVKPFILWPNLGKGQLNKDDVSTNRLESVIMPWAGSLNITKVDGVDSEVLIRTTAQSTLVDEPKYKFNGGDPDELLKSFVASGGEKILAVRLRGKLQSNFPDGLKKDGATDQNKEPSLKETKTNANVVIVSDVDFIVERFSVQVQQIFGTKIAQLINDNQNFLQNITENLLGSENLISIRSRGQFARPFTKVEELENYAQQRWQQEEMALQAELNGANARLAELQGKVGAEGTSKQVLNKAFLEEIKKFKEARAKTQDQLRTVRRNLRQDIEHLGTLLFLINTFMVPLALVLGSVAYVSLKKR